MQVKHALFSLTVSMWHLRILTLPVLGKTLWQSQRLCPGQAWLNSSLMEA